MLQGQECNSDPRALHILFFFFWCGRGESSIRVLCFVYDERLVCLVQRSFFYLMFPSLFHEDTMNYYCKLCSRPVVRDAGSL